MPSAIQSKMISTSSTQKPRPPSYSTRHSTIGARTFLFDWPALSSRDDDNDEEECWSSLPSRLHQLVQHYLHNPNLAATEARAITIQNLGRGGGEDLNINIHMEARRIALTAAVVETSPSHVWSCFEALFKHILNVHINIHSKSKNHRGDESNDISMSMDLDDDDDDDENSNDGATELSFNEDDLYNNLRTLQWLNPHNLAKTDILTRPLHQAVRDTIIRVVSSKIRGTYDQRHLYRELLEWKTQVLTPVLQRITCSSSTNTNTNTNANQKTNAGMYNDSTIDELLDQTISECYCSIRSDEIFDMIADYPDSLPGIYDLNDALIQSQKVVGLVHSLQLAFQKRLLHPGAQTGQILQVYMNTIKVLRVMDPSDCLLDSVAGDVRAYLRQRSDTVRCIITSLTDEDAESDLYEELQRHDAVPLEQAQYDSDDDEEPPSDDWKPAPSVYYQRKFGGPSLMSSDNGTRTSSTGGNKNTTTTTTTTTSSNQQHNQALNKNADLLAMLVRIYGSNDLFVDEYRIMLADKLLANKSNTDREVHILELLKLRFGETSMRQCEIMIKDMDDSKRIASNIHSTLDSKYKDDEKMSEDADDAFNTNTNKNDNDDDDDDGNKNKSAVVDAAIISHIFWPPLQKEEMKNHPRIQAMVDEFSAEYATYKNPRRLVWFQQLGEVQMELEVIEHDGEISTKEFTCSPLHATLISHFEDNDGYWTARELANETGVGEDMIRKKMAYWVNQNVVKVIRSTRETTYELASYHDSTNDDNEEDVFYDEDDGLVVSLSCQEEEEWEAYESYVVGMLSNLGQLPLEQIHNNLKKFTTGSEHKYNKTPQQLSIFLGRLCKEEKLECGANGMYKLVK